MGTIENRSARRRWGLSAIEAQNFLALRGSGQPALDLVVELAFHQNLLELPTDLTETRHWLNLSTLFHG